MITSNPDGSVSHAENWKRNLAKRLPDLKEILTWDDLFEEWEFDTMPESYTWMELDHALDILYGDVDDALARRYLARALAVADRAFAEHKFENEKCIDGFPSNRGFANSARQYARALLGQGFDTDAMRTIPDDMAAFVEKEGLAWNDHSQSWVLAGVRALLILGDAGATGDYLDRFPAFDYHKTELGLLKALIKAASKQEPPIDDPMLLTRWDKFFNRIRGPHYTGPRHIAQPPQQRFEIAIIRHRWFVDPGKPIDWYAVIQSIRR